MANTRNKMDRNPHCPMCNEELNDIEEIFRCVVCKQIGCGACLMACDRCWGAVCSGCRTPIRVMSHPKNCEFVLCDFCFERTAS